MMKANRPVNSRVLRDYYGATLATLDLKETEDDGPSGFFRYGPDIVCYGKSASGTSPDVRLAGRYDAQNAVTTCGNSSTYLPFDFPSVIENLRRERYVEQLYKGRKGFSRSPGLRKSYYAVRDKLPGNLRRHIQKAYFKGWKKIPFPNWPVDFTADSLHEEFLKLAMKVQGMTKFPFIWFWPEGASACAILTHDVETVVARDFSSKLMDLDHAYGFRASFQVVPEGRYLVPLGYWNEIRSRRFEFNIHDLSHNGYLFHDKRQFERRAKLINGYARTYGARGFRAGGMYRNLDWYDSFEFSYDMSVPNVAHLERQRGGCCTVMPFFVRNILEIPLTTSQDHSVFNTLEQYSIELWKKQISVLLKRNGLISFLTHPDYLIDLKPRGVYDSLLAYLRKICDRHNVWHALPGELDRWWRARNHMKIVNTGEGWKIEGPESHRARIAYAHLDGDRLEYTVEDSAAAEPDVPSQVQAGSLDALAALKEPIESAPPEIVANFPFAAHMRARRLV
ncbi:MAG: hypothetical protein WAM58_24505 [Candidatus Acidiferrum sp.]